MTTVREQTINSLNWQIEQLTLDNFFQQKSLEEQQKKTANLRQENYLLKRELAELKLTLKDTI